MKMMIRSDVLPIPHNAKEWDGPIAPMWTDTKPPKRSQNPS